MAELTSERQDGRTYRAAFVKAYPNHSSVDRVLQSKSDINGGCNENSDKCRIKADSPLVDMINLARYRRGVALLRAEEIEQETRSFMVEQGEALSAIGSLGTVLREELSLGNGDPADSE